MKLKIVRNILLVLAAMAVLTSPALAQGNGKGNGHGNGNGNGHGNKRKDKQVDQESYTRGGNEGRDNKSGRNDRREVTVFGPRDRDLISGYYRNQYSNLPPGLAKRGGNLPPGLERQLERNGTLPPGLQERMQPFPPQLESQLPPLPPYYSRGVIGGSVIIFNSRTRLIVDVIHNIF